MSIVLDHALLTRTVENRSVDTSSFTSSLSVKLSQNRIQRISEDKNSFLIVFGLTEMNSFPMCLDNYCFRIVCLELTYEVFA